MQRNGKICEKLNDIEIAKRMLASGKLTYEDIAAFTDLTLEEIEALAVQKSRITKRGTISLYTDVFLISL
mgnify:CR=1 FL=1